MSAEQAAAEARPTVVLLHSSASSSRQWQPLMQALEPSFRVHALDLHGHGERPAWRGTSPLTLADEAALAQHVMTAGPVHLVGHSYGAAVALKLALLHPQRVRSLVAFEPVLMSWLADDEPNGSATQALLATACLVRVGLTRGRADDAARHFIDYWSGAGQWSRLPLARQAAMAARMPAIALQFDALAAEPSIAHDLQTLAARRLPSLWLSGEATVGATGRIAERLRVALPEALHERLPNMGHMGPITHAAEVNRRVLRFLQGHAQGAQRRTGKPQQTNRSSPGLHAPASLR